jgi:stage II sporulation protein R
MKKLFFLAIGIMLLYSAFALKPQADSSTDVKGKLIRFHVVANSDSAEDQRVKLEIRDAILKQIGPRLSKSSSREESLNLLKSSTGEVEKIANSILLKENKNYMAKASVGQFTFPVKSYGDITLPAGEYTALRVALGNADGKNWWCVMFPPLCFIDVTSGLTTEKTDNELKKVLNNNEIENITTFKGNEKKLQTTEKSFERTETAKAMQNHGIITPSVEFKLKSVEMFDKFFGRIKGLYVSH